MGFKMVEFSKGRAKALVIAMVLTIQNPDILSRFQMIFNQMAAICPDFKWLGFRISDPIGNQDHLQTNLFLNIGNAD